MGMSQNPTSNAKNLKVLLLPSDLYGYLMHVFEQHIQTGIPSSELQVAGALQIRLLNVQEVDYSRLGEAQLTVTKEGVSLDLAPKSTTHHPARPGSTDVPEPEPAS